MWSIWTDKLDRVIQRLALLMLKSPTPAQVATPAVDEFIAKRSSFCSSIVAVLGSLYCDLPATVDVNKRTLDVRDHPRFKTFLDILSYGAVRPAKAR